MKTLADMNLTPEQLTEQTIAAFAAWKKDPKTPLHYSWSGHNWDKVDHSPNWRETCYYRIAPFTLGNSINGHVLGEGEQWHRVDGWTSEMLPAPYRPLILGEDEGPYKIWRQAYDEWSTENTTIPTTSKQPHQRTTRPLPSAQLAPGSNPDRLTCEQVGTNDGWRLLDKEEGFDKTHLGDWYKATQIWCGTGLGWRDTNGHDGYPYKWNSGELRTRLSREELAALDSPKPKFRDWNCAEDVPMPICWLRNSNWTSGDYLIVSISDDGFGVAVKGDVIQYPFPISDNFSHSIDRKTWQPCQVEVK